MREVPDTSWWCLRARYALSVALQRRQRLLLLLLNERKKKERNSDGERKKDSWAFSTLRNPPWLLLPRRSSSSFLSSFSSPSCRWKNFDLRCWSIYLSHSTQNFWKKEVMLFSMKEGNREALRWFPSPSYLHQVCSVCTPDPHFN